MPKWDNHKCPIADLWQIGPLLEAHLSSDKALPDPKWTLALSSLIKNIHTELAHHQNIETYLKHHSKHSINVEGVYTNYKYSMNRIATITKVFC